MSNCMGCFHEKDKGPDEKALECSICIRNPKYPTMKMPEEKVINGLKVKVPKDMYIAKDRKEFEERKKKREESEKRKGPIEEISKPPVWPQISPWTPSYSTGDSPYYWESTTGSDIPSEEDGKTGK